jgi:hypothetical protein
MSHYEEHCREAVSVLLRAQGIDGRWHKGPDPPDWLLEIEGRLFAVEVTSIHGATQLQGGARNWTELSSQLSEFGHDVCRQVMTSVGVCGRFFVTFPPFSNMKSRQVEIVDALNDYFISYPAEAWRLDQ